MPTMNTQSPRKRRYNHVLVDLDNTLLDFGVCEKRIQEEMAREFGYMPRTKDGQDLTAAYRAINSELWRSYERGEIDSAALQTERFRRLIEKLDVTAAARPPEAWFLNMQFIKRLSACAELVPLADRIVPAIAPIVAITNGFPDVQYPRIKASGLGKWVDRVFISEEIGSAKPSQAYFDHVLSELGGPDPRECIVIGDSLSSDIAGGLAAGMDTVWFDRSGALGVHAAYQPEGVEPTWRITSLAQLKKIVLFEPESKMG